MAEVTDVTIVAGVPTVGDGTVPTLSKTNTVIGAVNETAPASDTASSGLNGRMQRIAQRVTSLIALFVAEDAAHVSADPGIQALAVRKATPANLSDTDGDYEPQQVSGGFTWVAGPPTVKLSSNFNRPGDTTAYTANDAVADNTTAGSVTKQQFTIPRSCGRIIRVKIRKSDQTVATPTIRAWFFDVTFTPGAGDNATFAAPLQDSIGFVDVAVTNAGSDDALGWTNCDIPIAAATAFCVLQTLSAFTPANAETFTIEIHAAPG